MKKFIYFLPIFIFLAFFCQHEVSAQQLSPTYTYHCFCSNPNPTPGSGSFRNEMNNMTDNPDPVNFCTTYCTGKSWTYIGYQKPGEDAVFEDEKYREEIEKQLAPELLNEHKYSCTCQDENKKTETTDSVQPSQPQSVDPVALCAGYCNGINQIAIGYTIDDQQFPIESGTKQATFTYACRGTSILTNKEEEYKSSIFSTQQDADTEASKFCENKQEWTDCNCLSQSGTVIEPKKEDQADQTAPSAGTCLCNNGATSTITDCTECDANCKGGDGVKTCIPPSSGAEESTKQKIDNPLTGITSPIDLIKKIINYVLGFVGALAVLIIIYSGFVYMTSRGNEKQIESAKSTLTYAVVGLVIIFASIIIVNAVISAIGG